MKLYGAANPAPNPRRVRIFLAEKGAPMEETPVALRKREHKAPEFRAKNSLGQIPVLELDDGTTISESVSICRYFEALHPEPPLFGRSPLEQALVDQWVRRIEFTLMIPIGMVWRHDDERTAALLTQFKEFGASNRETATKAMQWLDRDLSERPFIAGEDYTIADIVALTTIDFGHFIGVEIPEELGNLRRWHERVSARPSASA